MKKLVIFGVGDVARLAQVYFTRDSDYDVVAFAVDGAYRTAETYSGLPLVAFEDVTQAYPPASHFMFVAIGYAQMNHGRAAKYAEAKALGYQLATYISSKCTWLSDQKPGDNCFILEDNTVQPFVTIGNNVTLWSGNHVGHDAVIDDHCFVTSHVVIAGHVHVREYRFLGINATIRNDVTLAPETLVGAGSLIMSDTEPKSVYMPERTAIFKKTSDKLKI